MQAWTYTEPLGNPASTRVPGRHNLAGRRLPAGPRGAPLRLEQYQNICTSVNVYMGCFSSSDASISYAHADSGGK